MDRDIAVLLSDVGRALEWPEPPTGLPQRVVSRISVAPETHRRHRLVPAMAILALLVAAVLTVSPVTRDAVADFLGIGGVKIESGPTPDVSQPARGSGLRLGDPVSAAVAQQRVDFDIRVPSASEIGEPDQVYLDSSAPSTMVSLVYGARPGFELADGTDVSVLITEFSAPLMRTADFFKKLTGQGTIVDQVTVNGHEGYWLTGEPHVFYYRGSDGDIAQESIRLVENVLLWEQDGVTFRVETTGSLDQALAIASALR